MDDCFFVKLISASELNPGDRFLSPWPSLRSKVLTFDSLDGIRLKYHVSSDHLYSTFVTRDFKVWRVVK